MNAGNYLNITSVRTKERRLHTVCCIAPLTPDACVFKILGRKYSACRKVASPAEENLPTHNKTKIFYFNATTTMLCCLHCFLT